MMASISNYIKFGVQDLGYLRYTAYINLYEKQLMHIFLMITIKILDINIISKYTIKQ